MLMILHRNKLTHLDWPTIKSLNLVSGMKIY
ncbi:hypothetical protein CoNPh26_CDS0007 [Staphylococcus phage S-CoN_Ph26]|nr:hypothetical protein CoNPh26_CDS0007 [Staphylococcus phage S-CoN_Ph26]WNM55316.1 hypothetical protein CoNPh27_CDS0050 [Staphylococcus phage S-CoN_Ph27]